MDDLQASRRFTAPRVTAPPDVVHEQHVLVAQVETSVRDHRMCPRGLAATGRLVEAAALEIRLRARLDQPHRAAEIQVRAALDGVGVVWTLEHYAAPFLAAGKLVRVLESWCAPFPGYFLYYPSRRQQPAALSALIETLRLRK
jgi:DNA-binding transcriptional LysR family regulator